MCKLLFYKQVRAAMADMNGIAATKLRRTDVNKRGDYRTSGEAS
jgi:hypothetical protein